MGPTRTRRKLVSVEELDVPTLRRLAKLRGVGENPSPEVLITRLKSIYIQGFKVFVPKDGGDPEIVAKEMTRELFDKLTGKAPAVRRVTRSKEQEAARKRLTTSRVVKSIHDEIRGREGDAQFVAGPAQHEFLAGPSNFQNAPPSPGPSTSPELESQGQGQPAICPSRSNTPIGVIPSGLVSSNGPHGPRTMNTIPPPPASPPRRGGVRADVTEEYQLKRQSENAPPRDTNITEEQLGEAYDHLMEVEHILVTVNTQKEEHIVILLDEVEKILNTLDEDMSEFVKIRLNLERAVMGWKEGLVPISTEAVTVEIKGFDEDEEIQAII